MFITRSEGLRIRWYLFPAEDWDPHFLPTKRGVLGMIPNRTWWLGSSSENLEESQEPFHCYYSQVFFDSVWLYLYYLWVRFVFDCNLVSFLLRCGTRPNESGTKWDSNSLVKVYKSSLLTTTQLDVHKIRIRLVDIMSCSSESFVVRIIIWS